MTYVSPPFPAGLRPGSKSPSAKGLQAALKTAGYLSRLVLFTDNYGPFTVAAVKKFHSRNPAYGSSTDGAIGPKGWARLHHIAYDKPPVVGEPAHDYHRVTYGGHTVNIRTRVMMQRAEARLGAKLTLSQGSYHTGVAASAGTHDGGGCIDVSISSYGGVRRLEVLRVLRQVGFAAWIRTPAEGFAYHIHACAIGDREMAYIARSQVHAYFAGRNGLANNGPDSAPASVGRPYPSWAAKYK